MKCFVGIDTSNYTTSAAICDESGAVVANLKSLLTVKSGERGLRQSDAVFAHTKNLPELMDALSEKLDGYTCAGICFSATPRNAEGSYMPCFLCGRVAAHSFASGRDIPIFETSHQNGHIMAALYSSGVADKLLKNQFLAFHVSGGTTEALLVTPKDNGSDFKVDLVGETKDINAGQAIDRAGVMMGLDFPCGKELEKLARSYQGSLEKRRISVDNGSCCLSGVENISKKIYEETQDPKKTAAFVFDFICRTLCEMARQLQDKYGRMPILFAGGVMSNTIMREQIRSEFDAYFADAEFSADNAAGVALIGRLKAMEGEAL